MYRKSEWAFARSQCDTTAPDRSVHGRERPPQRHLDRHRWRRQKGWAREDKQERLYLQRDWLTSCKCQFFGKVTPEPSITVGATTVSLQYEYRNSDVTQYLSDGPGSCEAVLEPGLGHERPGRGHAHQ